MEGSTSGAERVFYCSVSFIVFCFQLLFAVAGAALACAGALAPWVTYSVGAVGNTASASLGFFAYSFSLTTTGLFAGLSGSGTIAPVGLLAGAASLLLIGFVLGLVYSIALIIRASCVCRAPPVCISLLYLLLGSLSFVFTFLGTLLGGGVSAQI